MFTEWRKSSYSGSDGQSACVEVGLSPTHVGIRDTKSPTHGHLTVSHQTWRTFVATVRRRPFTH